MVYYNLDYKTSICHQHVDNKIILLAKDVRKLFNKVYTFLLHLMNFFDRIVEYNRKSEEWL